MTTDLLAELEQLRRNKARLEDDVSRLMTLDHLTGLLNRTSFINKVDAHFNAHARSPNTVCNDRVWPHGSSAHRRHFGPPCRRLCGVCTCGPASHDRRTNMLCCRLDYRSFALFIPQITDPLEAMVKAKASLGILAEPLDWVDRKLTIDIGAGVALSGDG